MVVISCGLGDLSRYGKRAHALKDLVTRRFCCRKHPNMTFAFNSIIFKSYDGLNEKITEFNKIMFKLSLELKIEENYVILFSDHTVLINSPLMLGRVIEIQKEYGGNGCQLTFPVKRLVTGELINALHYL